jgi:hypothetical protein
MGIEDSEFSECLAEALAALGSQNLQCFIGSQNHLTVYLQQVILLRFSLLFFSWWMKLFINNVVNHVVQTVNSTILL